MPLRTVFLLIAAVLFLLAGLGGGLIAWGLLFLSLALLVGDRGLDALRGGLGRFR
jgi:hypothetical protein